MPLLPVQFGPYTDVRPLGKGGMGAVYRAHDPRLRREVVLKVCLRDDNPEALERFRREGRAAAGLAHTNLCPVYEFDVRDGIAYLVMAFVEGPTLSEWVGQRGGLSQREATLLVAKLAAAMQVAHDSGVVHRDLKPSNIIINKRGEPVILDFGLARQLDDPASRLTQQGAIYGTPAYMAPEQAGGDPAQVGPAADVYSLGVILYELLTGEVPFTGPLRSVLARLLTEPPKPLHWLNPAVHPTLEEICLKALAKEPEERQHSMTELATSLSEADGTLPSTAMSPAPGRQPVPETMVATHSDHPQQRTVPTTVSSPLAGRRRRFPWLTITVILIFLGVLGSGAWLAVHAWRERGKTATDNEARADNDGKPNRTDPPRPEPEPKKDPPKDPPQPRPELTLRAPRELPLTAGEAQTVRLEVERMNCAGPITLRAEQLGAGLSANEGHIKAGQSEGSLRFSAASTTATGEYTIRLVADAAGVRATAELRLLVRPKPEPRAPEAPNQVTLALGGGVTLKMVRIPAKGKSFWMGSPKSEEGRNPWEKQFDAEEQHEVEFTYDYWLGVTEVTQRQWLAVMGDKNPSYFCKDGDGKDKVVGMNTDDFPVERVSWTDAKEFCRKLTDKLNDGHEYRLPREAEWEYACRGGASSKDSFPFYLKSGPSRSLSGGLVNFWSENPYGEGKAGTPLKRTAEVRTFPEAVNAFGLYDMHGNVWEWCEDWYGEYPKGKVTDPRGPDEGSDRVFRGGSWGNDGQGCRAACRSRYEPSDRGNFVGFRLARVPVH
jgi:formylglycine-generating enzyme required for sulfatase activity/serine/threonine protein kinase